MDSVTSLELDGPQARLVVAGEFDAAASLELRPRLATAVREGCIRFRVDASAVTFVDTTALGSLVWLRRTVAELGGEVVVTAASDNFGWSAAAAHLGSELGLEAPSAAPPDRDERG